MDEMISQHKQYDSVIGAKLLLAIGFDKGIILNVTKVQKMLYIIYSFILANRGYKVFNETPKAWPYGPVFPRTRNKVDFENVYKLDDIELKEIIHDKPIMDIFEDVVRLYSPYTAKQLSDWSHSEGGAWDKTVKQKGFVWGDFIPDEFIIDFFKGKSL